MTEQAPIEPKKEVVTIPAMIEELMQEIKRMQGMQVSMQSQMNKILKELKDKR